MKLLLVAVNAKYIHSNLAVYSLKAAAGEWEKDVEIAEFTINNRADYILEEIYKRKPKVLCFSCYIWNLTMIEEVIREYHKLCPGVPVWVGGPEVSFQVEDFLRDHPQVTGVMIGEGEETFRELCAYYHNKIKDRKEIKGIAYSTDGMITVTPAREVANMSKIPFSYKETEDFSNRIIYYESSRGCPFSCSYCLSSVDKQLRFRNLELVKEELQFFIDRKVPQIKFVDRTFNCNHDHAMAIWQYIKEHDNGITNFHFEVSADLIRDEEMDLMEQMRPGLIQLEIGVQSTNEPTIREIHRTMKLDRLKEVVGRIRSFGNIHQHLDLIAGLPYEDYDTFRRSFDQVYQLRPNQLQMGFLKVLKGSYMYDHVKEYHILYHDNPPYEVMSTGWLSYEDVMKMKQVEEMLEVYYNSGQFEITMQVLNTRFQSAFAMYEGLGAFYEQGGHFGLSHSRIGRCRLLLDYVLSILGETKEDKDFYKCVEEALIFDLYYRENCKSRPSWARDMGEFKAVTHRFCKNGKLSHAEPFHYDFLGDLSTPPERREEEFWVLFSYDRRDPLNHQAAAEYIFLEESEEKE